MLLAFVALVALTAIAAVQVLQTTAWIGRFEAATGIGLGIALFASGVAIAARHPRVVIAIAAGLLAANAAFMIARVLGVALGALPAADSRFAIVLTATTLLAVGGLLARRQWGRQLAIALGAAGLGSGGLNALNFWQASGTIDHAHVGWYLDVCRQQHLYLVTALGGALIVVCLVATRGSFVTSATWRRREPVVRWLRASLVASFVAAPMLLVYAWMQPLAPQTQTSAVVLAAALAVGATLAVRGKLIGALLLVGAGLGLAAQTIATWLLAPQAQVASYYAVFWAPAALIACVTGTLLARPTWRLLWAARQPD
jgi:hypothetical protein